MFYFHSCNFWVTNCFPVLSFPSLLNKKKKRNKKKKLSLMLEDIGEDFPLCATFGEMLAYLRSVHYLLYIIRSSQKCQGMIHLCTILETHTKNSRDKIDKEH